MHDLGITYSKKSPEQELYLEQSNEIYDSLGLQKNWARLQVDLGKMYLAKMNFRLADSLFTLGLNYGEATQNTDIQIIRPVLTYKKTIVTRLMKF